MQPDLVTRHLDAYGNLEIDIGYGLDFRLFDHLGDLGFLFDRHIVDRSGRSLMLRRVLPWACWTMVAPGLPWAYSPALAPVLRVAAPAAQFVSAPRWLSDCC